MKLYCISDYSIHPKLYMAKIIYFFKNEKVPFFYFYNFNYPVITFGKEQKYIDVLNIYHNFNVFFHLKRLTEGKAIYLNDFMGFSIFLYENILEDMVFFIHKLFQKCGINTKLDKKTYKYKNHPDIYFSKGDFDLLDENDKKVGVFFHSKLKGGFLIDAYLLNYKFSYVANLNNIKQCNLFSHFFYEMKKFFGKILFKTCEDFIFSNDDLKYIEKLKDKVKNYNE